MCPGPLDHCNKHNKHTKVLAVQHGHAWPMRMQTVLEPDANLRCVRRTCSPQLFHVDDSFFAEELTQRLMGLGGGEFGQAGMGRGFKSKISVACAVYVGLII